MLTHCPLPQRASLAAAVARPLILFWLTATSVTWLSYGSPCAGLVYSTAHAPHRTAPSTLHPRLLHWVLISRLPCVGAAALAFWFCSSACDTLYTYMPAAVREHPTANHTLTFCHFLR